MRVQRKQDALFLFHVINCLNSPLLSCSDTAPLLCTRCQIMLQPAPLSVNLLPSLEQLDEAGEWHCTYFMLERSFYCCALSPPALRTGRSLFRNLVCSRSMQRKSIQSGKSGIKCDTFLPILRLLRMLIFFSFCLFFAAAAEEVCPPKTWHRHS